MIDLDDDFEAKEADRRLANTIRIGTVAAVDVVAAKVKVQAEEILTDWLPWLTDRAGTVTVWNPPEVGEQVILLAPSGELAQAVVLMGIYQQSMPAPSQVKTKHLTEYPDGSKVEYDFQTHELTVISTGKVIVEAAVSIDMEAPVINITGATAINLVAPTIGLTGSIELTGDGDWSGNITHHDGSLSSNGIVLHTHKHGGVQSGGSQTGLPV